jgi:hypothetical protein
MVVRALPKPFFQVLAGVNKNGEGELSMKKVFSHSVYGSGKSTVAKKRSDKVFENRSLNRCRIAINK